MYHYYRFFISSPYGGTDHEEWLAVREPWTDHDLSENFADLVFECAESYAYLRTGWGQDFDNVEDYDEWLEDCFESSYWNEETRDEYLRYCKNNDITPIEENN